MKKLFLFWLLAILAAAAGAQTIVTPASGAVFTTTGTISSGTITTTPSALTAVTATVLVAAAGNTTLLTISTVGAERIFVQFDVTTQALDAFLIQARTSAAASFVTIYSAAADYTAPTGLLVGASGDLTTVAAAGSGWFIMDVRGLHSVKILASGAVNNAAVTIYAGGQ